MSPTRRPGHTRQELDRLDNAADRFADLLGVAPEDVGTEPTFLRLILTLDQAERVLALLAAHGAL